MGEREGKLPEITDEEVVILKDWTPQWNPFLKDEGLNKDALKMIVAEDRRQIKKRGPTEHRLQHWFTILAKEMGELADAIDNQKPKNVMKEATQVSTLALKIADMTKKWRISPLLADRPTMPKSVYPQSAEEVGARMRNWYKTSVPKCKECHDIYLVHTDRRELGLCARCELILARQKGRTGKP